MTQYHQVPDSTVIYWPSTIKYQPLSLYNSSSRNAQLSQLDLFMTPLTSHAQYTWSSLSYSLSTSPLAPPDVPSSASFRCSRSSREPHSTPPAVCAWILDVLLLLWGGVNFLICTSESALLVKSGTWIKRCKMLRKYFSVSHLMCLPSDTCYTFCSGPPFGSTLLWPCLRRDYWLGKE